MSSFEKWLPRKLFYSIWKYLVLQYNRGRFGPAWSRTKKWVLGLLEVGQTSRRPILKVVRGCSREDLLPTIIHHVRGGSQIVSDEWQDYQRALRDMGFDHHTVCHKSHFVDPNTGAHTQHLERAWQTFKFEVWRHRGNRTTKLLQEHLKVIEWEYWLGRYHRFHIIGRLLHDIHKNMQFVTVEKWGTSADKSIKILCLYLPVLFRI